jgi:MFS transporter, DHA1 family, tetracycline resistance protein
MEIKEAQSSESEREKVAAQPTRSIVLPLSQLNPLIQTRDILQFPQLRLLLLSYLLFWMIVILPSSSLPSLLADRLNWTPEQISPLLVTFGIIVVLVQLVVLPLLLRRFQEIRLAIVGGLLARLGFFLIGLLPITSNCSDRRCCENSIS